jgi:hypothetical protein
MDIKIKTSKDLFEANDKLIDAYIEDMVEKILRELNSEESKNYIWGECVDLRIDQLKRLIKDNIFQYLVTNKFVNESR